MWRLAMKRRAFLAVGGRTATFAVAARMARSDLLHALEEPQMPPAGPEKRVATVIQAYDGQGNHRTGTEVDPTSAEWGIDSATIAGAPATAQTHRPDPGRAVGWQQQPSYLSPSWASFDRA